MDNAYVVGYGLIDALGNNPKDCFQNLLNDQDYCQALAFMQDYKINRGMMIDNSTIILPEGAPRGMTKMQHLAMHATAQALTMSGLSHSPEVSVIFSTILNDIETLEELFPKLIAGKRVHPKMVLNRIPDMIANHISMHYQYMGTTTAMTAACASGITSIDYAMRLLDEYDYVIVGGGDAGCFPIAIKYFGALNAMGNHSCPFDDGRTGFVMGDGAGVLILQSAEMVKKYNSTVHAVLYPPGLTNDAYDDTSPSPDGRGAKSAMTKALKNVPGPIDAVNAHATSTLIGDTVEYQSIIDHLGPTPIYAPKSKIGHTMAASGIVETIYAIESMKANIIPHIHNLVTSTIDQSNCLVRKNTSYANHGTLRTLNNSFGFGGKCASQVVEVTRGL
jgi:3-oxoacyl-[acyl-carrier-protein] synthase II